MSRAKQGEQAGYPVGKSPRRQERQQILAVVIRQYRTGLYRSCVSLNQGNLVTMGTHEDERSAEESLNRFWKAYDEGEIRHSDDLLRWLTPASPSSPTVLSENAEGRGPGCTPPV
ncbi:MAG: hypothetical protein ACOYNR_03020 [Blastocatellia bacterium]